MLFASSFRHSGYPFSLDIFLGRQTFKTGRYKFQLCKRKNLLIQVAGAAVNKNDL
jgi:hypothetical protein